MPTECSPLDGDANEGDGKGDAAAAAPTFVAAGSTDAWRCIGQNSYPCVPSGGVHESGAAAAAAVVAHVATSKGAQMLAGGKVRCCLVALN